MQRIAIYPGSFDPVTNGHADIVERGSKLFDSIIVVVLHNPKKKTMFSIEERVEMLEASFRDLPNIVIESFDGLTVDFAAKRNAIAILRGMRAISDFDFEFQLALMNRKLNRDIQTGFLMTGHRWTFISSSIVKEAAQFGGDINGLVPAIVEHKLNERFATVEKN